MLSLLKTNIISFLVLQISAKIPGIVQYAHSLHDVYLLILGGIFGVTFLFYLFPLGCVCF